MTWRISGVLIVATLLVGALIQHAQRLLHAEVLIHIAQKQTAGIEAAATLERANNVLPNYAPYIQQLADHEIDAGRMQLAEFWIEKIPHLRPSWPYGWTQLAKIKIQNREYDDALEKAFIAASLYGSHDPNIVQWLSRNGVLIWARLGPRARHVLRIILDRALNHPNQDLLIFAFQHQRQTAMCEGASPTAGLVRWCAAAAQQVQVCGQAIHTPDAKLFCDALTAKMNTWTNG